MVKCVFFIVLALSFGSSACNILDRSEEKVVITVGERDITTDELKRDIKYLTSEMGVSDEGVRYVIDPLLNKLVDHYLVLEYGRQKGITVSEEELESEIKDILKDYPDEDVFRKMLLKRYLDFEKWKDGLRQQLLIKKIMGKVSENITPVTFEEINTYYETHRNEFKRSRMVKFRQIVTRTKGEAEDIRKRLKKGENMDDLARQYSITPEAEMGGEVGWVSEGDLHESMEKPIFALPVGRISQITKTPHGYHIFEVQSKRPKGFKSLSEAMDEIESKLLLRKQQAFHERWLIQLRGLFPVRVDRELLATLELG
ncbi:MAG: peptidyl-prolyl cis-trans isomerase [Desulfobacteraceae bacterium]|jgi:peptidyl-prolyl cis-trans isomerase C